ncbi:hypothetical protein CJ178_21680 [Rhodococcus sp. ACPA4]|uniref:hypothetical protein n=1 Tax=Rhodococcus sp. ACPA4 TaxID=2028571 RepID=UPI000BD58638|nr:hypothetical protein [Rhodococcus sp. ACPA4]PBC43868.1 hypothetical protein CJ178_21680 [Rhodococcus sp. ACPA4]
MYFAGEKIIQSADSGSAGAWFFFALMSAFLVATSVVLVKFSFQALMTGSASGQAQVVGVVAALGAAVGAWIAGGRALDAADVAIPLVSGVAELIFWGLIIAAVAVGAAGSRILGRV